ncbi:MAG: hypothetical protein ABIY55_30740 [Kofleriaceae bacterium]
MSDLIDDRTVDDLRIIWDQSPGYVGPRVVDAPTELRMIRDFLSRETWQHFVQFIMPGVMEHHGRVMEYSGFRFQSDLDADDDPFQGVEMFDPIDTIYIREAAFDRLMSRYFDTVIRGVVEHQRPEAHEPWWQGFVASARVLADRLGHRI